MSRTSVALGQAANQRGREAEERVLRLLHSPDALSWVQDAEQASAEDDRSGVDVLVWTDAGLVRLQVKAGTAGWRRFASYEARRIAVVIAKPGTSDDALLRRIVEAIKPLRDGLLVKRGGMPVAANEDTDASTEGGAS